MLGALWPTLMDEEEERKGREGESGWVLPDIHQWSKSLYLSIGGGGGEGKGKATASLLSYFPPGIRRWLSLHTRVRGWTIQSIVDASDITMRVQVMRKMLTLVGPGLVGRAVASGLMSPEVRLFKESWIRVFHGADTDVGREVPSMLGSMIGGQGPGMLGGMKLKSGQVPCAGAWLEGLARLANDAQSEVQSSRQRPETLWGMDRVRAISQWTWRFKQAMSTCLSKDQTRPGLSFPREDSILGSFGSTMDLEREREQLTWKDVWAKAMPEGLEEEGRDQPLPRIFHALIDEERRRRRLDAKRLIRLANGGSGDGSTSSLTLSIPYQVQMMVDGGGSGRAGGDSFSGKGSEHLNPDHGARMGGRGKALLMGLVKGTRSIRRPQGRGDPGGHGRGDAGYGRGELLSSEQGVTLRPGFQPGQIRPHSTANISGSSIQVIAPGKGSEVLASRKPMDPPKSSLTPASAFKGKGGSLVPRGSSLYASFSEQLDPSIRPTAVLSLVGAKASKEDHPRRNHVFRVQTEDGAVYLLQAASSQDVREWISRVEEAANEANVRRRSLMDKMAGVGALKEGWEEGKGQDQEGQGEAKLPEVKAKVFGYPLDTLSLTPEGGISGEIPIVIEKCLQEIERRGLEEVGIYRISGTQSAMERLILAFEEDVGSVDLGDEMWSDINVVTGVLKQLLRSLPEPLMTYELYEGLIEAMSKCSLAMREKGACVCVCQAK